jgi:uncharacterized protein
VQLLLPLQLPPFWNRGRIGVVKASKFVHFYDLGEHIALWHSLRMKPVFLTREIYADFLNGRCDNELKQELLKKKIILSRDGEDDDVIAWMRAHVPHPAISLGYFILSERCNLACKYCFVGNSSNNHEPLSSVSTDMTTEVADKAITFFARQLELSETDFDNNRSQIIFFGGEPLINFEVLEYVAQKVNELKNTIPVLASTDMTIITNGTLLTKDRIIRLHELGVTVNISIDGFSEEANEMRIDAAGNAAYGRILAALDLCKEVGIIPSLSVTLSEKTIKDPDSLLSLIKDYDIRGLGYNILLSNDNYQAPDEYYEEASQFIINSFKLFRTMGIYEDRIMRKLNTFARSQVYFSDCGATSGGQVVFSPDGRVGICQGMIAEKENFVVSVDDSEFDAKDHPVWKEWANLSPINNDECLSCEALGICGGGCPVNARLANPDKGLHCLDKRQCTHAKSTLKFLIEDLYGMAKEHE